MAGELHLPVSPHNVQIMRECIDCGELKKEEDFTLGGGPGRNRRKYCKKCKIIRHTAWMYNTTREHVVFLRQRPSCDICGEQFGDEQQNIDHCHESGVIRGVLCLNCNMALGKVKDDPRILLKMIKYLNGETEKTWGSKTKAITSRSKEKSCERPADSQNT